MGTMYQFDEKDWVNPYLSPRRTWVCTQLANLLPNAVVTVRSIDNPSIKFELWTGQSQAKLVAAWESEREGFRKAVTDEEKKRACGSGTPPEGR